MKPTIINLLFAGVLFFGQYLTKKNLLKMFFQNKINLKNEGWKKLNYYWISFFLFVATLNEIVWRTQSELFWVNFKVWGLLPITIIFTASTFPVIKKYKNGNTLEKLKWGIVPGWAKKKDFKALINARLETIDEKVSFIGQGKAIAAESVVQIKND